MSGIMRNHLSQQVRDFVRGRESLALPMPRREGDLVRAALEWCRLYGILAWRNNTGAFKGEHRGRSRFVRYGHKGSGDIFAVLPGGRFASIECKVVGRKASESQAEWIEQVRASGGIAGVVYCIDDLVDLLGKGKAAAAAGGGA